MQYIIFTDLDGTLLDHDDYSFDKAQPALDEIKKRQIPLVICTSKTRKEIEEYRRLLENSHPFISENGGGVFIPQGYFDFDFDFDTEDEGYKIMKLGTDYDELIKVVRIIQSKGIQIKGFNDMTPEEISKDCGLSFEQAKLAKSREFDETFSVDRRNLSVVKELIMENGLRYTLGSRYHHIMGDSDKGKAVRILIALFRRKYGAMKTMALGDSENDFEMLDSVDMPIIVKSKDGKYSSDDYKKVDGIGPKGWNIAIKEVIS